MIVYNQIPSFDWQLIDPILAHFIGLGGTIAKFELLGFKTRKVINFHA
jgi:hypothetical protein